MSQTKGGKLFQLSDRIRCLPVVHGSGDFAFAVRDAWLNGKYDCLAVPLPEAFQRPVERAIREQKSPYAVTQRLGEETQHLAYVPVEPCQPVIRALQSAMGERVPRRFIGLASKEYRAPRSGFPDPYALEALTPEAFAVAVMTAQDPPLKDSQQDAEVRHLAFSLHRLELEHEKIFLVCSILDWPWIKRAYDSRAPFPKEHPPIAEPQCVGVSATSLSFFLSEIPFITELYKEQREHCFDERSLSIEGIKELVIAARDALLERRPRLSRRVTPQALRLLLRYVRNLTLVRRRLRPDLVTLVEAAQQAIGDAFALQLLKTARLGTAVEDNADGEAEDLLQMGPGISRHPLEGPCILESLLPGQAMEWRNIEIRPEPPEVDKKKWTQQWDPSGQCSWPPEDSRIESFNQHVREQARLLINQDNARTEVFTSSLKDGIDFRETLRNWHTGDVYVREFPPNRGSVEVVVFLFDSPADPNRYTWRSTWFAEHEEESTLAFFATDFHDDLVGPGIARARYGGAFFLYPPRPIGDIWQDRGLPRADTLEERLIAGACFHSTEARVVLVSPGAVRSRWRQIARELGRTLVHLPMERFSANTVDRLRTFHVLNGRDIRSFAASWIRSDE